MNSLSVRRNERSPQRMSLERHSCFTVRTQRSAKAFRFGLWGGSFRDRIPSEASRSSKAAQNFASRSVQQVAALSERSRRVVDCIARHLNDPGLRGVAGHAGKSYASGLQIEEEKDVGGGESTPGEHLDREEVGARKHRPVRRDEVLPGGGLTAFWCSRNAVAPKHVSDSLVGDMVAEVGEGTGNPIMSPTAVPLNDMS
jgi:hypothetical protein